MIEPEQKSNSQYKDMSASTKDHVTHLVNSEGMLYYKLLTRGVTNTADIYCQQMRRLADAIQENRPTRLSEVMLLHDNACSHSANLTKNTIQELGWEVIPHQPYSPDLTPSDFQLFRSIEQPSRN